MTPIPSAPSQLTVTGGTGRLYRLVVTLAGDGTGTVTGAGIACGTSGPDCAHHYAPGTTVTLTATADSGSAFTGWSGAGTGTATRVVTMNADQAVSALFAPMYVLTVTNGGLGTGTITSSPAGITCGVDCSESYVSGTTVTLTATPASGSTFSGWAGSCTGTGSCVVVMDQARDVGASFALVVSGGVLSIPATITRYDGGSGSYTITNGVAFRPGDVTTTLLSNRQLRVFVGDVEQSIYTEALDGRHPDGSVKVVLIQFLTTIGATPLSGEIRVGGQARATTDIAKQPINSWPRVLLFPSDSTFLCAATPFWRPLTPMSNRPTGGYWDVWEAKYRSNPPYQDYGSGGHFGDALAVPENNAWVELYPPSAYPWGRHHYEFFAMTGDSQFLYRAVSGPYFIIYYYYIPNNFGIPEWNGNIMSDLILHYWMTGDTASRNGIRTFMNSPIVASVPPSHLASRTSQYNYGRVHHNCLSAAVCGYHLNLSPVTTVWSSETAATWADKALKCMEAALTQQWPDGHNTWSNGADPTWTISGQQNWMVFERSTAMLMYYYWVNADSRILPHIQAGFDYVNNNYWFANVRGWSLGDATMFPNSPDSQSGAPDLNGFAMEVVSWLYRQTHAAALRTRGDEAIDGIANFAFWPHRNNRPKQFNEEHWGSWPWIAARLL